MPVHYGSKQHNFQTISSPLGTQIPQAVGAAYSLKLSNKKAISACYFGEGAASEGDFHCGLNLASTRETPVVFICRNNGYAISTPATEQYRGDGIISRAAGYGMLGIRVDGNDILAVYAATTLARKTAIELSRPVIIEAMTYRRGHHSTSDDSTRYRSIDEIQTWQKKMDPMKRFRSYLELKGWWSQKEEEIMRVEERKSVIAALNNAEKKPKPALSMMFDDVYYKKPKHLLKQESDLLTHIAKYPDKYK